MAELVVPAGAEPVRLDAFLAAAAGSRTAAARLIDAGGVRVDGAPRPRSHLLRGGETVAFAPEAGAAGAPVAEEEVAPAAHAIRYADEHLLVVEKPAGVVVHPGRGRPAGTLAQVLAPLAAGGAQSRAGIVHRLDRDTSGLLVVARSEAVHAALRAAIKARAVRREYLALVEGRPGARRGTIDAPLGRDRRVRTRFSPDTDAPRAAITHFETERALARTTLLRVRLETGRTHQIRAHLLAIGTPVCGDPDYGGRASGARLGLERQFLHAGRLAFEHPVTGAAVDVTSPLPADLAAALGRAAAE